MNVQRKNSRCGDQLHSVSNLMSLTWNQRYCIFTRIVFVNSKSLASFINHLLMKSESLTLARYVEIPQQPPFARQAMNANQKALQPREIGIAFRRDQFLSLLLARIVPSLRDLRRVIRRIRCADK